MQLFCGTGRDQRDLPSNMEPAEGSEGACEPGLPEIPGGLSGKPGFDNPLSQGDKNSPRGSRDKENGKAQAGQPAPKRTLGNPSWSTQCQAVSAMAVPC